MSRWRRAVPLVFIAMPMVIATIGISAVVPLLRQATQPEFRLLSACLSELESPRSTVITTETQRQALETFVAGRFGPHIKDERFWQSTGLVLAKRRPIAERAVVNHPTVSEAELAAATAQLQPFLDERERNARPMSFAALGALMALLTITVIGALCFVVPVIFRGSVLLRLAGVATVAADGAPASRLRILWRGLIAWSPVIAVWLLVYFGAVRLSQPDSIAPIVAACAVLAAGAFWAIVRPDRGLHDRIAGTWLVPR